jgi:hypothetical protein
MRVSNDRYSRDLRSIDLARRMLKFEARTQTICAWTTLSAERVRNLSRSHGGDGPGRKAMRHRGPSPSKLAKLMEVKAFRSEAAAIAGLCGALDVIPAQACPNARVTLPGISRGERLCYALELFHEIILHSRITMEQLVLLVLTLAERDTWALEHCTRCHASILIDRLTLSPGLCGFCEEDLGKDASQGSALSPSVHDAQEPAYVQQSLF